MSVKKAVNQTRFTAFLFFVVKDIDLFKAERLLSNSPISIPFL